MGLESVASVGLEVLKHREQIGAALNGVSGLANAGGKLFGKIMEQVGSKQPVFGAAPTKGEGLNTFQALAGFAHFDADHNGQISKLELTEGLQKLTGSPNSKLNEFGQKLLQNYEKAALQDGQANSFSYRDLGRLAQQDGQALSVSAEDWQKLSS